MIVETIKAAEVEQKVVQKIAQAAKVGLVEIHDAVVGAAVAVFRVKWLPGIQRARVKVIAEIMEAAVQAIVNVGGAEVEAAVRPLVQEGIQVLEQNASQIHRKETARQLSLLEIVEEAKEAGATDEELQAAINNEWDALASRIDKQMESIAKGKKTKGVPEKEIKAAEQQVFLQVAHTELERLDAEEAKATTLHIKLPKEIEQEYSTALKKLQKFTTKDDNVNNHVKNLIEEIEALKNKKKLPTPELTKVLKCTRQVLTGSMTLDDYAKASKGIQAKPSMVRKVLSALMVAIGLALAASAMFVPGIGIPLALAAASALCLGVGGWGIFGPSSKKHQLSEKMNDIAAAEARKSPAIG